MTRYAKPIQVLLDEAACDVRDGLSIEAAAAGLVRGASTELLRMIAVEFVEMTLRGTMRATTRQLEQRDVAPVVHMAEAVKTASTRPRLGTAAYRRWVSGTEEGRAYEAQRQEDEAAHVRRVTAHLAGLVDEYKAQLHAEWTEDLLNSSFALPDGEQVTWGSATTEQHQARVAMFMNNAMTNLEGAARHERAIDDLVSHGSRTLNDLVSVAA